MTSQELLTRYKALGFRLLYWERNADPSEWKGPRDKGWNDPARAYPIEKFDAMRMNIGLFTGYEVQPGKFLADVDFDWPPGLDIAARLIPSTGFAFGRKGKKISHALFTTPQRFDSIKFCDYGNEKDGTGDGDTFVEVRSGDFTHQTMIAPSLHSPGTTIDLVLHGDLLHVEVLHLKQAALDYAIGCLLLKRVNGGLHHDGRTALAGFLLLSGLSEDRVTAIGEEVCRVQASMRIPDMSSKDVQDMATVVRSTAKRLAGGKKVSGGPKLAEFVGGDAGRFLLARLNKYLGRTDDFIRDGNGNIVPKNQANVARAIMLLGHTLSYNEFSDKLLVDDKPMEDREVNSILTRIEVEHRFQPPESYFERIIKFLAWKHPFHPVKDYLSSLVWDQTPRIDTWLIEAADVEDSPYTRAVSSIMLVAAVRRIMQPGCKYDEMVVWETPLQGTDKSSAARTLCPKAEWFSDDLPLNIDSKQMIEKTLGKWIVEASDLAGKRKTEIEHLKATLSRQVDGPARLAYAHFPVERPRHFILIGTTNSSAYLTDPTGSRRFWPLALRKRFDVAWIKANRDQLWAEAVIREATNGSIRLPESLWPVAAEQQEARREVDAWESVIRGLLLKVDPSADGKRRVTTNAIWDGLSIPLERRDRTGSLRISDIMQRFGFKRTRVRPAGEEVQVGFVEGQEMIELSEGDQVEVRVPGEDDGPTPF